MTVERYGLIELCVDAKQQDKPFINGKVEAVFINENEKKTVEGFYDGDNTYKIRFMPSYEGSYQYRITGNCLKENEVAGEFEVTKASECNHGPVGVADTYHFAYADGTKYTPIGTTSYAWVHQPAGQREKTVKTLSQAPFNKIRMCIFPKHYIYNQIEPELFPFVKREGSDEAFDLENFDTSFFRNIDTYVTKLMELGIEADLILFHPYDKWGFASLPAEVNDRYLEYVVARYAAFRNVWWSLANEYDFMEAKTPEDWNHYGELVSSIDPYHHLIGVHNGINVYDGNKSWLTHISLQNQEVEKFSKVGRKLREQFGKPVIFDEVGYEGDINAIWGCLPGEVFMWRAYEAMMGGAYVTHGETFYTDKEDLWWSHGGELKGESAPRLAFMKKIFDELPGNGLKPVDMVWDDSSCACEVDDSVILFYYGIYRPVLRDFYKLDENKDYHVEIIDTWNMTIEDMGVKHGHFSLDLPGRQWMLVRVKEQGGHK